MKLNESGTPAPEGLEREAQYEPDAESQMVRRG